MKNEWLPTFNRLSVEPLDEEQTGILQLTATQIYQKGKIIGIGPMAGIRDGERYHTFKLGEIVVYFKAKALEMNLDGEKIIQIDDNLVLTVKADSAAPEDSYS